MNLLTAIDPRLWLLMVALCLGSYSIGRVVQSDTDKTKQEAQLAQLERVARDKEHALQQQINEQRATYEVQIRGITDQRDAAIDGLRERPSRLPEPARTACKGATGAELSRPDAELLTRLAAEADGLRAKLAEYEAWADAVTHSR